MGEAPLGIHPNREAKALFIVIVLHSNHPESWSRLPCVLRSFQLLGFFFPSQNLIHVSVARYLSYDLCGSARNLLVQLWFDSTCLPSLHASRCDSCFSRTKAPSLPPVVRWLALSSTKTVPEDGWFSVIYLWDSQDHPLLLKCVPDCDILGFTLPQDSSRLLVCST